MSKLKSNTKSKKIILLCLVLTIFGFCLGIWTQKQLTPSQEVKFQSNYEMPSGWKVFSGNTFSEIGFDPKTMTTNNLAENGLSFKLTYGKDGELIADRYNFSQNPDIQPNSPLVELLEYSFRNERTNKMENILTKEYVIDGHPSVFLYGFENNDANMIGAIYLGDNYFIRITSKGIPYSEVEKILRTIKTN